MKLGLRLIFAVILGIALHQTYKPTTAFGERWGSMARYGIGSLGMLPCMLLIRRALVSETGDEEQVTIVAFVLALASLGTGTVAGHLMDRWHG